MSRQPLEGWIFVGSDKPADGQEIETMTVWGEYGRLLFGLAQYRRGSYWAGEQLLDTPSYWRPVDAQRST